MLGHEEVVPTASLRSILGHRSDTATCHYRAVERVIGAMHVHLDDSFSLEDMADVAIMSPFHFNRTFRELTGIPPCQFLSAVRLEAAKRLLLTTKRSVTDVCFDVGYNSLGTFIRRFTDLVGQSPRRLRSLAQAPIDGLLDRAQSGSNRAMHRAVSGVVGRVTAPPQFQGPIFVGLFSSPVPKGGPVACSIISAPGPYRMSQVPHGRFFLFVAGLAWSKDPRDYYLCESALRGGGQPIWVSDGAVRGSTHVALRAPSALDPPILIALPCFLGDYDGARSC